MDNEKKYTTTLRLYKERPVHAQAYRCLKNYNTDIFRTKDDFIAEAIVHFSKYLKQEEEKKQEDLKKKEEAQELAKKLETIVVEFKVKTGKDGKSFDHVSTKHIAKKLLEEHGIKIDKRKFINAYPVGALGTTKLKIELYKGVIATINVHLSEK